jgi:hypothetical protein
MAGTGGSRVQDQPEIFIYLFIYFLETCLKAKTKQKKTLRLKSEISEMNG